MLLSRPVNSNDLKFHADVSRFCICATIFYEHVHKNMPKILNDVHNRAIAAAKAEIETSGYDHLTMRGIADRLNISAGTLYHYFADKEALVGALVKEDWEPVKTKLWKTAGKKRSAAEVCRLLYDTVSAFSLSHQNIFAASSARALPKDSFHLRFVDELAELICEKGAEREYAVAIAELILAMVRERQAYETYEHAIRKLTGEESV